MRKFATFVWACVTVLCLPVSFAMHVHIAVYIGYVLPLVGLPWNFRQLLRCPERDPRLFAWAAAPLLFFYLGFQIDFWIALRFWDAPILN
ncbi:MAG: hypothetical protein ACO1NO_00605 [Burkholderiaceae bacterium]